MSLCAGNGRWVLVGLVVLSASPVAAEVYRSDDLHCAVTLPEDWKPWPAESLAKLNAAVAGSQPGAGSRMFDAAYGPGGAPFVFPYVLLQVRVERLGWRYSYAEVEKKLLDARPEKQNLSKVGLRGIEAAPPVVDRVKNCVSLRYTMQVDGVGPLQVASQQYLAREGVFCIHGYCKPAEVAAFQPTFDAITQSFRVNQGFEFEPQLTPAEIAWRAAPWTAGGIVLLSAMVGVIVLFRRRRRRRREREEYDERPMGLYE